MVRRLFRVRGWHPTKGDGTGCRRGIETRRRVQPRVALAYRRRRVGVFVREHVVVVFDFDNGLVLHDLLGVGAPSSLRSGRAHSLPLHRLRAPAGFAAPFAECIIRDDSIQGDRLPSFHLGSHVAPRQPTCALRALSSSFFKVMNRNLTAPLASPSPLPGRRSLTREDEPLLDAIDRTREGCLPLSAGSRLRSHAPPPRCTKGESRFDPGPPRVSSRRGSRRFGENPPPRYGFSGTCTSRGTIATRRARRRVCAPPLSTPRD